MLPDEGEDLCRDMEGLSINSAKYWLFVSILQVHTSKMLLLCKSRVVLTRIQIT